MYIWKISAKNRAFSLLFFVNLKLNKNLTIEDILIKFSECSFSRKFSRYKHFWHCESNISYPGRQRVKAPTSSNKIDQMRHSMVGMVTGQIACVVLCVRAGFDRRSDCNKVPVWSVERSGKKSCKRYQSSKIDIVLKPLNLMSQKDIDVD